MKTIPPHPYEWEFDSVKAVFDGLGCVAVDITGKGTNASETLILTPGGAVLLAEQLLKAARKASA